MTVDFLCWCRCLWAQYAGSCLALWKCIASGGNYAMFSSWECALPNSYCGFFVSVISIETNKKHYFYIHNYTATYTTYTTNVIYLGLVKEGVISLGHLWWVACWVYFSSTPCSFTIMNFVIVQASTQMKLVPRKYTSGILTVSMCMYSLIKSCILKRSATPHKHTHVIAGIGAFCGNSGQSPGSSAVPLQLV